MQSRDLWASFKMIYHLHPLRFLKVIYIQRIITFSITLWLKIDQIENQPTSRARKRGHLKETSTHLDVSRVKKYEQGKKKNTTCLCALWDSSL